ASLALPPPNHYLRFVKLGRYANKNKNIYEKPDYSVNAFRIGVARHIGNRLLDDQTDGKPAFSGRLQSHARNHASATGASQISAAAQSYDGRARGEDLFRLSRCCAKCDLRRAARAIRPVSKASPAETNGRGTGPGCRDE